MRSQSLKTKLEISKKLLIITLIVITVVPIGLDFLGIILSRYFTISIPMLNEIKTLASIIFESRIGMWTVIAALIILLTYFVSYTEKLISAERKKENLRIALKEEMFANFNQMFLFDKDLKLERDQYKLLNRNLSLVKDLELFRDVLALYKNWEKFDSTISTAYGLAVFQCAKIALEFMREFSDLNKDEKEHISTDLKSLEEILHRSIISEAELEYLREGIYKKYKDRLEAYLNKLTENLL